MYHSSQNRVYILLVLIFHYAPLGCAHVKRSRTKCICTPVRPAPVGVLWCIESSSVVKSPSPTLAKRLVLSPWNGSLLLCAPNLLPPSLVLVPTLCVMPARLLLFAPTPGSSLSPFLSPLSSPENPFVCDLPCSLDVASSYKRQPHPLQIINHS